LDYLLFSFFLFHFHLLLIFLFFFSSFCLFFFSFLFFNLSLFFFFYFFFSFMFFFKISSPEGRGPAAGSSGSPCGTEDDLIASNRHFVAWLRSKGAKPTLPRSPASTIGRSGATI